MKTKSVLLLASISAVLSLAAFEKGDGNLPKDWVLYGKLGADRISCDDKGIVRITDNSDQDETGISAIFPAAPGNYVISVDAEAMPGSSLEGAMIQLRALPSGKFAFRQLQRGRTVVGLEMPADTTQAQVFIWSYKQVKPDFRVRNFKLAKTDEIPVELVNGEFKDLDAENFPCGWSAYAAKPAVKDGLLIITDPDNNTETGVVQDISLPKAGKYQASVEAKLQSADANAVNAFLQLRLIPQDTFVQVPIIADSADNFSVTTAEIDVPDNTTAVRIYLYTHKEGAPKIAVKKVDFKAAK